MVDFDRQYDDPEWLEYEHGTIVNVFVGRLQGRALYYVRWVDQQCRNAPQLKTKVYNQDDAYDEMGAYSKFRKDMKEPSGA